MTTIVVRETAPPDAVFAPTCLDRAVGTRFAFAVNGADIGYGTLLAAEVVDHGHAVLLTLDVPDDELPVTPVAASPGYLQPPCETVEDE